MIVYADDGGKIVKGSVSFIPYISPFSTYFAQVAFDTFHKSLLSVDTDKERSKKKKHIRITSHPLLGTLPGYNEVYTQF